jgi:hypothetical protein
MLYLRSNTQVVDLIIFLLDIKDSFPIKEYKQSIYANMAALPLSTMAIKSRRSSSSSTDRQLAPTKLEE